MESENTSLESQADCSVGECFAICRLSTASSSSELQQQLEDFEEKALNSMITQDCMDSCHTAIGSQNYLSENYTAQSTQDTEILSSSSENEFESKNMRKCETVSDDGLLDPIVLIRSASSQCSQFSEDEPVSSKGFEIRTEDTCSSKESSHKRGKCQLRNCDVLHPDSSIHAQCQCSQVKTCNSDKTVESNNVNMSTMLGLFSNSQVTFPDSVANIHHTAKKRLLSIDPKWEGLILPKSKFPKYASIGPLEYKGLDAKDIRRKASDIVYLSND